MLWSLLKLLKTKGFQYPWGCPLHLLIRKATATYTCPLHGPEDLLDIFAALKLAPVNLQIWLYPNKEHPRRNRGARIPRAKDRPPYPDRNPRGAEAAARDPARNT